MSEWEANGKSDEWYTPKFVFDALAVGFDLDVAAPYGGPRYVPCKSYITSSQCGLRTSWEDCFVWMNPPFGGRNGLMPWLEKFFKHKNGLCLTPDRTSAPWWQYSANHADAFLLTDGKIKFERPDRTIGKSPGAGVTIWAAGEKATNAILTAQRNRLGLVFTKHGGMIA